MGSCEYHVEVPARSRRSCPKQNFTCKGDMQMTRLRATVYPKKYTHGFCFAVLCCGYTLTDFPISIRLTSLAFWQSNDCPSASKATLMNMDKYFMWIYYERLHNHNKAKHNKTVCIFLGIYCSYEAAVQQLQSKHDELTCCKLTASSPRPQPHGELAARSSELTAN